MYKKIIKALYESKINRSLNESYATVKDRFIKDGADKSEVKSILDLHKKLKDMKRLKTEEINIDVLAKGKSFDEFKSLMSRYSEKDTATKIDNFNELKNKIVAENDEWVVYKIDTAAEAYLFHGLTKWCISSGSKENAKFYFDSHIDGTQTGVKSNFYFIVRKEPIGDNWDYIAVELLGQDDKTYWDKNDDDHLTIPKELNIPKLSLTYKPVAITVPKTWNLNRDGSYNVYGNVDLSKFKHFIEAGKLTIRFNIVTGYFECDNCELISLEGCPKEVRGSFKCSNNELTSLEGGPKEVGIDFDCSENKLTSLKGSPKKINGFFACSYNKLNSLEGAPKKVGETFYCSYNTLTSLKYAPKEVDGGFVCVNNSKKITKEEVKQHCKVKGDIYV